jgi:hypothetical protein
METEVLERRLRRWAETHAGVAAVESAPGGVRLAEVATGKRLDVDAAATERIESRRDTLSGQEYLVIHRTGIPPVALAAAGFAFAPDPRNTGSLPAGAPPVICFTDYRRLFAHLRHIVPQEANRREALELLMILIAALDGARAVGLETATEEAELEPWLRRLERA